MRYRLKGGKGLKPWFPFNAAAWVGDRVYRQMSNLGIAVYIDAYTSAWLATPRGVISEREFNTILNRRCVKQDGVRAREVIDRMIRDGLLARTSRGIEVLDALDDATDQDQYQKGEEKEKKRDKTSLINEDLSLPAGKTAGPMSKDLAKALESLVAAQGGGLVDAVAKQCGDGFRKKGWAERIHRIEAAGRASELFDSLEYIRKSLDPRITDIEPVREPGKYMAGCIKTTEAKIAGAAGRD